MHWAQWAQRGFEKPEVHNLQASYGAQTILEGGKREGLNNYSRIQFDS
jgi:hypothetical protein